MLEFSTSEKLYTLFYRCSHLIRCNNKSDGDISPGQTRLLAIIDSIESPTQQKVLDKVQIKPASLSEMLTKLEKSQCIERKRDEQDKRNMLIFLTEKGKTAAQNSYVEQKERSLQAFEVLNEEERQQLLGLLCRLASSWENQ